MLSGSGSGPERVKKKVALRLFRWRPFVSPTLEKQTCSYGQTLIIQKPHKTHAIYHQFYKMVLLYSFSPKCIIFVWCMEYFWIQGV